MSSILLRRATMAALAALGFFACSAITRAADATQVKTVVELFTSQGCSSCPPADRLLTELAHDPETLAMSLPVDYWDYIGWKDTLAEPTYTERQRAYARSGGRGGAVYTPQAVVNGVADAIGSDRVQIEAAKAQSLKRPDILSAPLSVSEQGGAIDISLGAAPGKTYKAGVYLIALASKRTVTIQRGENAGSTLTYSNVVRGITKVGEWTGAPIVLKASLDQAHLDGADSYAVIVQEGGRSAPSAILAAAKGPQPASF